MTNSVFEVRDRELYVSGVSIGKIDEPHVQEILLKTREEALASTVIYDNHACPRCGGNFQLTHESADGEIHTGYCDRCLTSLIWHVNADKVYDLQGASGFRSIENPILEVMSHHARVSVERRLNQAARQEENR